MQERNQTNTREKMDSKACLVTLLQKIPQMLIVGVAGALLGSGLYLLIATIENRVPKYMVETEYYVDFAEGRLEAKDYYNAFTWNDVIHTDFILGKIMEKMGESYERSEIGDMIAGDILSDVRYLTIQVKGEDADLVETVNREVQIALEQFSMEKDEFDTIYQIENSGVHEIVPPKYTLRVIALGSVIGFFVAFFWYFVQFSIGDCLYTKTDVMKFLEIPCIGILTKKQNQELEKEYQYNKEYLERQHTQLVYLDFEKEEINNIWYEKTRSMDGIVLCLPFGKKCVRKTLDMMENLQLQDCKVVGVVLTQAEDSWLKLYGLIP